MSRAVQPIPDGSEAGYTLVEAAVSLALMLTLLLPIAVLLTTLTARPDAVRRMEALALARHTLETLLQTPPDGWMETRTDHEPWVINTQINASPNLATVTVEVYRREEPEPLVSLTTARYIPPSDRAP